MLRAYKYQLDPNESQKIFFAKCFGACRWIYNRQLSKRIELYKEDKKSISAIELINEIPGLKRMSEFSWLNEVPSQCLQQAVRNMDAAYFNFFRKKKGFPKFRVKNREQSFQLPSRHRINFERSKVKIPKLGWVDVFIDREFSGTYKTATVSKNPAGKYFISILVEDGIALPECTPVISDKSIGIDVGLKHFAVLSTGEKIDNPKHFEKSLGRLKVLQRRASRKVKGSNRRKAANLRVAKLHYRISCQRKDFLHKLSTRIIRENQTVIIEDLNVQGMLQNHNLAKAISSASWSEFFRQLEYKAAWNGKNLVRIGRFDPSSKMCTCGVKNETLTLKDRDWTCASCGTTHDRDLLAANNIKKFGLRNTGKVIAEVDVEMLPIGESVRRQDEISLPFYATNP